MACWLRKTSCSVPIDTSRVVEDPRAASAAATPAAWPMPIAVAVRRLEASASDVAEWQRPATSRFSTLPRHQRAVRDVVRRHHVLHVVLAAAVRRMPVDPAGAEHDHVVVRASPAQMSSSVST